MQLECHLLRYMLQWENWQSETLLNLERLPKPLGYCLHTRRDCETLMQKVDLPETFAHLIGLEVETPRVYDGDAFGTDAHRGGDVRHPRGRYLVYRGTTREGQDAAVIRRETEGWTEEDYKRDREFVAAHRPVKDADLVYTNGDSLIPGARALEGVFKARMFAGLEA